MALDVDLAAAIDQDVGHRRIGHQRLQRPQPEHLVLDIAQQQPALGIVQRRVRGRQQLVQQHAQLVRHLGRRQRLQRPQVDALQQLPLQPCFQVVLQRRLVRGGWRGRAGFETVTQ